MSKAAGDRLERMGFVKIALCLDCQTFRYWPVEDPAPVSCGSCQGPLVDMECVRSTAAPAGYDRDQIREFYLRLWEAGMSRTWPGDHERISLPGDDEGGDR